MAPHLYRFLALSLPLASSWRTSGILPKLDVYTLFVGKFCYDYKPVQDGEDKPVIGSLSVSVDGQIALTPSPVSDISPGPPCWGPCNPSGSFYLVVFDDEQAHWQQELNKWGHMTCQETLSKASFAIRIDLEHSKHFETTVRISESIRPRFWYFTFVACGVDFVQAPFFEIHATNTMQGYQSEFGIDKRGSLLLQVLASTGFTGLFYFIRHVVRKASGGTEAYRSRPLLRMLLISSMLSAIASFLFSLHWAAFAADGHGLALFEILGTLSVVSAKAILTLLQLLTAKGWALFYASGEAVQRQLILCGIALIVVTSVACEFHALYFTDWSATLYLYESWPGTIILILNVLLFIEAWRSMRETYRLETSHEVRMFYASIFTTSMLYFLTLPVSCVLATAFSPWVRAKYIDRIEVVARFLATAMLASSLRPSRLDAMVNARLEEGLANGEEGDPEVEEEAFEEKTNLNLPALTEQFFDYPEPSYKESADDSEDEPGQQPRREETDLI